jgi:hypothetical protein
MSATPATSSRRNTQPDWLFKYIGQNSRSIGWTVYADGLRFALVKKTGRDPEYHLLEKHTAVQSIQDRAKHRLVWKGALSRAGRNYIAISLALSNAAGKIMRADGNAQCTQCRKLLPLSQIGTHPCKEH